MAALAWLTLDEACMLRFSCRPGRRSRLSRAVAALAVLSSCLWIASARAASTWYVAPDGADTNSCSAPADACRTIDAAVGKASAGDTVRVAAGVYPGFTLLRSVAVIGAGRSATIVDARASPPSGVGVFVPEQPTRIVASISGMTITNGNAGIGSGGGIYNSATLTVMDSVIRKGEAGGPDSRGGGGIYNRGTLTLVDSTVTESYTGCANQGGGGILNSDNGIVQITGSIISDNFSTEQGGGILNHSGIMTITDSFIGNNVTIEEPVCRDDTSGGGIANDGTLTILRSTITENASPQRGGGIFNTGTLRVSETLVDGNGATREGGGIASVAGEVTVVASTASNNTASRNGGGIDIFGGNARITSSTISGNVSSMNGGGIGNGGTLVIRSSTIYNNRAETGGGLYTVVAVRMQNTVLARNTATTKPDCSGASGSRGYNLVGNGDGCGFTATTGDLVGSGANSIAPALGPLALNGGRTPTHLPMTGSPVIDAGNPATVGADEALCPPVDQRGVRRPAQRRCDIGAAERTFQAFLGTVTR